MADLTGADIRQRFQQSDPGSASSSAPPPAPGSGADIRSRFRAADDAAASAKPPAIDFATRPYSAPDLDELGLPLQQPYTGPPNIVSGNAPGYTQSNILPLARRTADINDPNAPWYQGLALSPGPFRALGQTPGENVQIDPATNALSLSPEAAAVGSMGANPLRFSGGMPLVREAPGTFTAPLPVTADELRAAVVRASPPAGPAAPPGGAAPSGGPSPGEAGPAPGGAPGSVGAAVTPHYEPLFTAKEEAAYRATEEGKKLLEPQIIGERDDNAYIPGVTPNNAELEQTAVAARDMKALGIATPEASDLAKEAAQRNNIARTEYSLNTEKTPVDITNEETAREADVTRDAARVFADDNVKGDVNMQPLIDQMTTEMNTRRNRQNSALQDVYSGLIKRLQDDDGNAVSMHPEEAWGLKQDIDRMTDKMSTTGTDRTALNQRRVASNIGGVADTLDMLINDEAPGYNDMVATYKAHSDKIREMQVLQGLTARLNTGPQGSMSFSAMQRFMKNVIDSRATGPQDLNPYKSISPETMQRLWNLRDDLRRSAGATELGRAAGSDTAANIMDVLRNWGRLAGQGAAHAGAAHFFGPVGPIALRMFQEATAPYLAARATQRNVSAMRNILNPDVPLRTPPGQENPLSGAPEPGP